MEIFKISSRNFKEIIQKSKRAILEGKVLVFPTDTVYGLIADATNKKAIEKIFKIKKRPLRNPIPIFVKDIKAAKKFVYFKKDQEKFSRKVWPGKVTLVLKRKKAKIYGVDKKTVGLRIPNYKFLNQLLLIINRPLTGTSANISGKLPSTKIREVLKQFKNQKHQPDLIIEAGDLPKSRPSTIIDLTTKPAKILRA